MDHHEIVSGNKNVTSEKTEVTTNFRISPTSTVLVIQEQQDLSASKKVNVFEIEYSTSKGMLQSETLKQKINQLIGWTISLNTE